MSDTAIVYSGATGLPAALKDAYFTLYSSPVGNYIYKYHLMALYGGLEIPNNTTDIGSQLGQSLLTYIPYITSLDFSDCQFLSGTIDVSNLISLTTLNTSATNISVDFGTGSHVETLHLGAPSSIVLKNPTQLTPSGVTVDSYGNLTSLDLRNVPNAATYSVFEKIMKMFIVGGIVIKNASLDSNGNQIEDVYRTTTTHIPILPNVSVTISRSYTGQGTDLYFYDDNFEKCGEWYWWNNQASDSFTTPSGCSYVRIASVGSEIALDYTAGGTIFKYVSS